MFTSILIPMLAIGFSKLNLEIWIELLVFSKAFPSWGGKAFV